MRDWHAVPACLLRVAVFFCLWLMWLAPALAQAPLPALVGRVADHATILDAACVSRLTAQLADWEKKSGDQLVVVTVPSLAGEDIASFSNRLFRQWAIGQAAINNGVLLVVAPADRQVRIEVGYGLEGNLTDALSSLIINTWLIPAFRENSFCSGISEGVEAIFAVLAGDGADLEARIRQKQATDAARAAQEEWIAGVSGMIVTGILVLIFLLPFLAAVFGKKVGPDRYLWLGVIFTLGGLAGGGFRGSRGFGSGGFGGGGGFSGGGGLSGGGGASGRW